MTAPFNLEDGADDQQLIARVVGYYHTTFKQTPDAQEYLRGRGIANPQVIDHFRLGFCDRTLGLKLPAKQLKGGAAIRTPLQVDESIGYGVRWRERLLPKVAPCSRVPTCSTAAAT